MPLPRKPKVKKVFKYGVTSFENIPDWKLELTCWAREANTGYSPWFHCRNAINLMWPEHIWHTWNEKRFSAFCDPIYSQRDGKNVIRVFSWMGCASAGKTFDSVVLGLAWWLADPENSILTMISTTKDSSRSRMWSVLQERYYEFKELHGFDGPHLINSSMVVESTYGDRKHAICTQAVESGELDKTVANIQGRHAKRMFVVVDEAMGTPIQLFSAIPNVFKGAQEVNLLFISNAPLSRQNLFMKLAMPVGGWNSVGPDMEEWRTRPVDAWQIPQGTCLHFNGKFSPNVRAGKTIYPFLYSLENWRRVETNPTIQGSAEFWSQDYGFPPPAGFILTVLSEELIEQGNARGLLEFDGPTTPIGAVDPAFGGDKCILRFGEYGPLKSGKRGVQLTETIQVPINVEQVDEDGKKVPAEYQIASIVRPECEKRNVRPEWFGVEATGIGRGTAAVLTQEWGPVVWVEAEGGATQMPASEEDPRPAKLIYDRRITELWFSVQAFVKGKQLGGLTDEDCAQFCSRKYDYKGKKYCLEKKEDLKPRLGRSPDEADAVATMIEVARQHGFETEGPRSERHRQIFLTDYQVQSKVYETVDYRPEQCPFEEQVI